MSKCKCGCGEEAEYGDYLPGHDLKHAYNLINSVGGRDNLAELLSYNGSAKVDLIFLDDKTNKQIDRISPLDNLCKAGDVQHNIGSHQRWIVTKVGDFTVEDWSKIPPTLYFPIYGHRI
jgi:hypothetical protein